MAMRLVDNQMMLQRPPELTPSRAREIQQMATNINMGPEIDKDTQEESARVHKMSESEHAGLRPDKDGGGGQGFDQGQPPPEEAPDEEKELLNRQASARLTNLPVDKGKYARREDHSIDIRV